MDFYLFLGTVAATIFTLVYRKNNVHKNKITASPPSSSLSLSLPSSSPPRSWEHDVFPSFHGPDVRKGFLSHVQKEFKRKAIRAFIDNSIDRGEFIGPELKRAIQASKIAIVLLSKNYASSSWCLDELVEIMINKVAGQTVLTVFYEVEPTDVKKQTGEFGKGFKETCRDKTKEKIETWRKALEAVATIAGYHSKNLDDEAAMIEKITDDISKKLNHLAPSPDLDRLIGMGAHTERMQALLRLDLKDEVRMIGIWGPPGIGKSTLVRFLFDQLSRHFQLSAIMVNIRQSYPSLGLDESTAKLKLQSQMLSQITNHEDMIMINHLGVAQERLKDRKVLLILDDVDQLAQLDALAGENRWFGPGSQIIITTEDRRVLDAHGMINHIYRMPYPSDESAFQIFCMNAFRQKHPYNGFNELAQQVTQLAGKLPLGLEVLGSALRGKSKQDWEMALPMLKTRLDGRMESIFKFSFDDLCDDDKDIFLYIAFFFNYQTLQQLVELLGKKFAYVRQRLHVLAEKSLISMEYGRIEMHKLLVQFGRETSRKHFLHGPAKRQTLVCTENICEVLSDDTPDGLRVIGIEIDLAKIDENINVDEKALERMSSLQFLRIYGNNLGYPGSLELLHGLADHNKKIRSLEWENFQSTCLPTNFNPESLVNLRMHNSKLKNLWKGVKPLQNLKWINLRNSEHLKKLPNLSTATNLQVLVLNKCISLVELPSSIGNLSNLQDLYLSSCSSLVKLPSSIGSLTNLQNLDLSWCSSLVKLPSSIGNLTNLQDLDLSSCSSLVKLPSSIGNLTNLQDLFLSSCSSLVKLPSSIGNLTNLQNLNLSSCSSLVKLPSSIGNLTNLQGLDLRSCSSLVKLPSSIGNLHKLPMLDLWGCSKLEVLPTNFNFNILDLTACSSLKTFPEISTNIEYLLLRGTAIEEVPSSIRSWSRLKELEMTYSANLKESPHAFDSITALDYSHDTEIEEVGSWVKDFSRLVTLDVSGCRKLVSLPQLPDSLKDLDAENCVSLERLDCSFRNPNFKILNFRNCFSLNEEARDLIIQTSTSEYSVLPGGEVPSCFTYRAYGSSVTVKLNGKPLRTSTTFKACIFLDNKGEDEVPGGEWFYVGIRITSKQKDRPVCTALRRFQGKALRNHLYIFEYEVKEVTSSTELVFEFNLQTSSEYENWKVKECGILQLLLR